MTGFDRNEFVGGLWHYTDDDRTSALKSENPFLGGVFWRC